MRLKLFLSPLHYRDASEIALNFDVGTDDAPNPNDVAANFLGFGVTAEEPELTVAVSDVALRGLASTPATAYGAPLGINIDNVFAVTETNNRFNVTVDGVSGFIEVPVGASYTMDAFTAELERQINALATADGAAVSGLTVDYDATTKVWSLPAAPPERTLLLRYPVMQFGA